MPSTREEIAYYVLSVEPNCCPDCDKKDGTAFLAEFLPKFNPPPECPKCDAFCAIVAVHADEDGALDCAARIRGAGGILKL